MRPLSRHALVTAALILVACGGDATPPADPTTSVATVTIKGARPSVTLGATLQLTAEVANAAGTILVNKTVNWVSSRPDVATVTSAGLVTAVAVGITVITAASEGHTTTATVTVEVGTRIALTSDLGEFIGSGQTLAYTQVDASISVKANATSIQLTIQGDEDWVANFQAPSGAQLSATTYSNARYPTQAGGAAMMWSGQSRGCYTYTGSFTIDSIAWAGPVGSSLTSVDLHFDQYCDGITAALHGTIHWRSDDPTVPAGPVSPPPSNLWRAPTGATPATGDYLYLQSDQGEWIGGGQTQLFQVGVVATGSGNGINISAGGYSGALKGMNAISTLEVGYYDNLQRYPFNNPLIGGMDWESPGKGCNTLSGWFVVDRVSYSGTTLTGIQGRFEEHCDLQPPALHGAFRWGQLSS